MKTNPAPASQERSSETKSDRQSTGSSSLTTGDRTSAPLQRVLANPALAMSPSHVMQLQKTIGNRSTMQLLQTRRQPSRTPAAPIQRALENETYNGMDEDDEKLAKEFFKMYDKSVQDAYHFVLSVPSLGAYAGLNGYTQLWSEKWNAYLANERVDLMAATFGYVVETLVSHAASEFNPGAPSGCSVSTQVTVGGTRPDLVLYKDGNMVAWLDLTAAQSADHILAKDSWEKKIKFFAESTYPSLDPAALALMVKNKNGVGKMSAEDIEKKIEQEKEAYIERKKQWKELGKEFMYKNLKKKVPGTTMDHDLNPSIRQNFIWKYLKERSNVADLNITLVPSILKAMGVPSDSWHFLAGFSESERAGETWLMDHAPAKLG